MISICITVKNRSRVRVGDHELNLFPNCIRSIAETTENLPCELVVCDWGSSDWPLEEWIYKVGQKMPVKVITAEGYFNRGRGCNMAAESSSGDILFFVDADALFSSNDVFERGFKHIAEGIAYFPVLFSYSDLSHKSGWWRHKGYGHCMVSREMFRLSGGWPEYDRWGKEDTHFYDRIKGVVPIAREEVPGFFHQWHPTGIDWKNRYSKHYFAIRDELERVLAAWKEISRIVKPGDAFILVDETRFNADTTSPREALPFLERNGKYWGAPTDDEMAICEFERMRKQGATHIVFGWMCFWWLRHYLKFDRHMRTHFRCVLDSENLIVFDLTDPMP